MTSDYWIRWAKAALIRAIKTLAQTAAALLGAGAVNVVEADWLTILGISATAAVVSLLTSLAGLPEVGNDVPPLFEDSEVVNDDNDAQGNDSAGDGER